MRYYASIFLRKLPYFLVVATLVGAVSFLAAINLPPAYESQMKLIVESPKIPNELTNPTVTTPAQEQLEILEQRLMTRANLLDIAHRLNVFEDIESMSPDRVVRAMRARTKVRIDAGRNQATLMTIAFEASSAQNASGVLNEYLTLIQKEDVQSRTGRATQTLEFFEQEVARLNEKLAERSAQILSFKSQNADALPESLEYRLNQQTLLQERVAQLGREIDGLEGQRDRLIEIFKATGQVGAVAQPNLTPEQSMLESLRNELNVALSVYSAENPRVKLLRSRIAQAEKAIADDPAPVQVPETTSGNSLLDVQLAEISTRMKVLEDQRTTAEAQLEKLNDTIARTPANSMRLDELQLEYENVQLQYNTAVDRLSRASTGERIELMSRGQRIAVIEPPATPSGPTKPNRKLIAGGGTFMGILLGLGLVVLLEVLNQSIRRPEDLTGKLGITPLATIPYIRTPGEMIRQRGLKLAWIVVILVGVPAAVYAVHTYYQPLDLIAERIMDKLGVRL